MVGHSACVSVNASFVIGWSLCVRIKVLCVIDYSVCVLIKSFVIDHSVCVPIIMSCVIDNRYSSPVHFLIVILLLKMVNFWVIRIFVIHNWRTWLLNPVSSFTNLSALLFSGKKKSVRCYMILCCCITWDRHFRQSRWEMTDDSRNVVSEEHVKGTVNK